MTKVEVETFEEVIVLQRSVKTESAVRSVLLECAGAFSPRLEDRSVDVNFICAVDVAGTEGLFGPPQLCVETRSSTHPLCRCRCLGDREFEPERGRLSRARAQAGREQFKSCLTEPRRKR